MNKDSKIYIMRNNKYSVLMILYTKIKLLIVTYKVM